MAAFDPRIADLMSDGRAARTLLAALDSFCAALVEQSLKRLDRSVTNGALGRDEAFALCYEIAAYRRIVYSLRQRVTAGDKAEARAGELQGVDA